MNTNDFGALRSLLAENPGLWRYRLLDPQAMQRFASQRGVSLFNGETVTQLWRLGLLRAEIVGVTLKRDYPGLVPLGEGEPATVRHLDARRIEPRPHGFGSAFTPATDLTSDVDLLFHPFRLYVLYHVARVFQSHASTTQYLSNKSGVRRIAESDVESLDRWTGSEQFAERFDYWNSVAELAIVCEPIGYPQVFNELRLSNGISDDVKMIEEAYQRQILEVLNEMGAANIDRYRRHLCEAAETIDSNTMIHVLLRLMSSHERHKLRGDIGASMLLWAIAEVTRRVSEIALGRELREEDELGFGHWIAGARKQIYGTNRIFDSSATVRRDFLSSMGLDAGVKVRCYVEGETEIGGLRSGIGGAPQVEFINLRGQFLERHGKGLQFVGSLENDRKSHIFSVVVLDGDDLDNRRAVSSAVARGTVYAPFFVFEPDVEFANFSIAELVSVAIAVASEDGERIVQADAILPLVADAATAKEFFQRLRNTPLSSVTKGEQWGTALMRFAASAERLPPDHKKAGEIRPLLEVARLLVQARNAGYGRSIDGSVVDSQTGQLCPRSS